MTRHNWHTERDGACTTVARHLPARFDVSVTAQFPQVSPTRLARQIRQDMWRTLQNIRGFSPAVRIEQGESDMTVTAGGRVPYPVAGNIEQQIALLLNDSARRARWLAWARRGGQ